MLYVIDYISCTTFYIPCSFISHTGYYALDIIDYIYQIIDISYYLILCISLYIYIVYCILQSIYDIFNIDKL